MAGPFALQNNTQLLLPINGAVTGLGTAGIAKVDIPPGQTYGEIILFATIAGTAATRAELASMWTQLIFAIDGDPLFVLSAQELMSIVEFYDTGSIGDTGYFRIPFQRLWMENRPDQIAPALGLGAARSVTISITQTSSTIDAVQVLAQVNPVVEELGVYVRYERITPAVTGSGIKDLPILPEARRPGEALMALHVETDDYTKITWMSVICDNVPVFDQVTAAYLAQVYKQQTAAKRTMQLSPDIVSLDFCSRGYSADALPMVYENGILRLNLGSALTSLTVIAEILTTEPPRVPVQG